MAFDSWSARTLVVKQSRSTIREHDRDRKERTIRGLGLRGPGSISELENTPSVRGMIRKVDHLVAIYETRTSAQSAPALKKSHGKGERSTKRGGAWRAPPPGRDARPVRPPVSLAASLSSPGRERETKLDHGVTQPRAVDNLSPDASKDALLQTLSRLRTDLDGAVREGASTYVLETLRSGAEALSAAFQAGGPPMEKDHRQRASMTAIQARALLRQYFGQLFSPDPKIADCAARIVAVTAPMSDLNGELIPLEGALSKEQSDKVAKALVQILSSAGDRCYTRIAPVVVGPPDRTGQCRVQGRVLVTKIVQALAGRSRIALPDRGDKARALAAAVTLEIVGAENPVTLDRREEASDDAVLIDGVFEVVVPRETVKAGLKMLLIVPGILAKRVPLTVA